jgi:hypothetical protein
VLKEAIGLFREDDDDDEENYKNESSVKILKNCHRDLICCKYAQKYIISLCRLRNTA